jgi:predicted dehydrogenase
MPTQSGNTMMMMEAASLSPAAVLSVPTGADLAKTLDVRIRAGIVGLGRVGARRADCVQRHPAMELRAICDINPQQGQNWPGVNFTTDYQNLVRDDLDAVFVCTYNNFAPEVVVAALKAGKHVFCEKPPGRCVADVERIRAAEQASPGLKLKFGFNHRYHESIMEAKQIVESGRFGRVLWLRGVYGKCGGIQFENEWRNDRNIAGGGILLDQGIHMLDLCRFFCGDFDQVKSLVTTSFWKIPCEDNAFAILSNREGQVAMIHSSATQWKHEFSLEICMEDGYVNLQGILSSTRSYGDERLTFARKQLEDTTRAFGRPREETIIFDTDDSWSLEVADFADAIRHDRPITSGNSHDALRAMELIETVYGNGVAR